jgi:hypothetical protein
MSTLHTPTPKTLETNNVQFKNMNQTTTTPKKYDVKKSNKPTSWISNLSGFNPNMGVSLVNTKYENTKK